MVRGWGIGTTTHLDAWGGAHIIRLEEIRVDPAALEYGHSNTHATGNQQICVPIQVPNRLLLHGHKEKTALRLAMTAEMIPAADHVVPVQQDNARPGGNQDNDMDVHEFH